MISLGKGTVGDVADYMLPRYACYLIAQHEGEVSVPLRCDGGVLTVEGFWEAEKGI